MSLQVLLVLVSLIGAASFFAAGWCFAQLPRRRAEAPGWRLERMVAAQDADLSMTERLTQLLTRLRKKGVRAVALADEQGLPIAGLGQETNSLAAFAGYVSELSTKMDSFAPFGTVRRLTLVDERGGELCACPLAVGRSGRVCLITLSDGPYLSPTQVMQVAHAAAQVLGGAGRPTQVQVLAGQARTAPPKSDRSG